jgi:uncharacterized protein (TIGR00661 family)
MKIFYAVQATGNGHISRAQQLLPYLQRYGKVDIFLSGSNSQLQGDLPVRFRSRGLGLHYNMEGSLHYTKIAKQLNPQRIWKEIRQLPVENYDVVINDFECLTALACAYKNVPSVQFGHQASFRSDLVPRPAKKEAIGEFILNHFAKASGYLGLHFQAYDHFIFEPVIKKQILQAAPANKGHITVYLSAYNDETVVRYLSQLKSFRFEIFSKETRQTVKQGNITLMPVSGQLFNESMINSYGVITGAGFETPAEVLHLGKKLMVIPIRGQYEQLCNAAALERLGVKVIDRLDEQFSRHFLNWIALSPRQEMNYRNNIPEMLCYLMDNYPVKGVPLDLLMPEVII